MLSFLLGCSYLCDLRNGLTVLVVAALGVLAALAVADALRSSPAPSAAATIPPTKTHLGPPTSTTLFAFGSRKGDIEEIGNTWAQLYAAGDPKACSYMGQGLCGFKPLPRFRASFEGATVQDIGFLNDHDAGAMFSNGIVVEFFGDGDTWTVIKLATVERHFFE
jgi:hypothetical protein